MIFVFLFNDPGAIATESGWFGALADVANGREPY